MLGIAHKMKHLKQIPLALSSIHFPKCIKLPVGMITYKEHSKSTLKYGLKVTSVSGKIQTSIVIKVHFFGNLLFQMIFELSELKIYTS